jgi:hypothetical protein
VNQRGDGGPSCALNEKVKTAYCISHVEAVGAGGCPRKGAHNEMLSVGTCEAASPVSGVDLENRDELIFSPRFDDASVAVAAIICFR